jgi:hypothetical protein
VEMVDPMWKIVQEGLDIAALDSIAEQPFLRWYMFNNEGYPDFLKFAREADSGLAEELLERYRVHASGGLDETECGVIPPNSRTAQHFYYVLRAISLTGRRDLEVMEIGGGYGNLQRIFLQLDVCHTYSIVDIDKISQVQRMYASRVLSAETRDRAGFFNIENPAEAAAAAHHNHDLVVSTFAVTETPDEMRDWYIDNIMLNSRYVYLVGQEKWRGYQNGIAYPDKLSSRFDVIKRPFVSDHAHDGPTFELFCEAKS